MLTISKYTKKSKIHLVNFPKDGVGVYTYGEGYELFNSWKVVDQVKRINEIKDNYDICVTMGTGERIAYLADLNYVAYYVGRDIDAPRFVKNAKEEWFDEPLHKLNLLERRFYKNAFRNAVAHIAGMWVFRHLEKYTKTGIKMDRVPIDPNLFSEIETELDRKKTKFTFFSPQRMGKPKGTDIIWKSLPLCKTDFEIVQVDWFDESTKEELEIKKQLQKDMPAQVKLVPLIKREDMPKYYNFADAVLGNMRIGTFALVELEAVFCKKPVVQYTDPKIRLIMDGNEVKSPFLPYSNEPKDIAETIDKVVESKEFRDKLFKAEYDFAKEFSDPYAVGEWWDNLFEDLTKKHKSIRKNSPKICIKLRMCHFLIANRLYWGKIKNRLSIRTLIG